MKRAGASSAWFVPTGRSAARRGTIGIGSPRRAADRKSDQESNTVEMDVKRRAARGSFSLSLCERGYDTVRYVLRTRRSGTPPLLLPSREKAPRGGG